MQIERLLPQDWTVLREMRLASLADSPTAFWATLADEVAFDQARWDGFVRAAAWFVAREADQRVGIAGALTGRDQPLEPELIGMWVAPASRGEGIGSLLVDAVCEWSLAHRFPTIGLGVIDGNDAALRVYARHGFVDTGERVALPRDPGQIEIRMRKKLARRR